ncbi:MAG: hypothetical protein RR718_11785 [Comamonas sp.]
MSSAPIPRITSKQSRSDENIVITVLGVFLLLTLVLGTGGYQYWKYVQEREQKQSDQQALRRYNDYLSTQEAAEPKTQAAATPAAPAQSSVTQKLLEHPGVTPGPGFNAPGVQATGVTIIDAIDQAQAAGKTSKP